MREGGRNHLKYLKEGGTEKRGGETKFLNRGTSYVKGWVPSKGGGGGGLEPPYELCT